MLKGLIVISHNRFDRYVETQMFFSLFNLIINELKWKLEITDDIDPDKINANIVLLFRGPEKITTDLQNRIYKLNNNVKLIYYVIDLHNSSDVSRDGNYIKKFDEARSKIYDRADKILCPYEHFFNERFPQYINKFKCFSHFVDYKIYSNIKFNESPISKCLLTGYSEKIVYPLRDYVFGNMNSNMVKLPHCGYDKLIGNYKIDKDYAGELNKYLCSFTDCSIFDYVLQKYFEIPASGALLLAEYTSDLDSLGFKDGKNYISVDRNNFYGILDNVISQPEKYENIRMNGRQFILSNHTNINRFEQFKEIISQWN